MTLATEGSDASERPIRVRAMGFAFDTSIPKWWLFGNPIPTHVANGLNLLFPDGERFFIRSVKHFVDRIEDDPALLARVRAFYGQEGRHGHEHERYNRILEQQGYDVDGFLAWYRKVAYGFLEPTTTPEIRLAVTAALEHLTASMADNGLRSDLMDNAHPVLRDLLKWHAAEEIEHKSVAYDVLQRVNPSWALRASGMVFGLAALLAFWLVGVRMLLDQERARGVDVDEKRKAAALNARFQEERRRRARMFRRAVRDYMRRDFHPDQHDNYELARAYLASIGRLDG